MNTFIEDKDRNVIPRLRNFATTLALGELDPVGSSRQVITSDRKRLESRIRAWEKNRTVSFAADLVSAAFVLGQNNEARQAATFVLSQDSGATSAARAIAERILKPENIEDQRQIGLADISLPRIPRPEEIFTTIHSMRQRLRDEPRNAILWADLAREYAVLGLEDKAERAMDVAVGLGPTNRFILRVAARLYIHLEEFGKAHYVLRKAESTRYDPWLLSAEIAVASSIDRTSHLVRRGQGMLINESVTPFQKNELASAIATLELQNGKTRNARNLFRQSLIDPTENSVAQVEWALRKQHMTGLGMDLDRVLEETPLSFEARASDYFMASEWRKALRESLKWLRDQPFATRPAIRASYITATVLEDYRSAEHILKVGLRANPEDVTLLNNLAFTYASSGKIEEAERVFKEINHANIKEPAEEIAIKATEGLIKFRQGFIEEGRALYIQAIEMAKGQEFNHMRAAALAYLAREEILSQNPEADQILELTVRASKNIPDPSLKAIINNVVSLKEEVETEHSKKMALPSSSINGFVNRTK